MRGLNSTVSKDKDIMFIAQEQGSNGICPELHLHLQDRFDHFTL